MLRWRLVTSIAFACFVLLTACEHKTFDFSSFAAARAKWRSYNFTTYQIEQERRCFCEPYGFVQLFIRDNKIVSGISPVQSRSLRSIELEYFKSIDQMFDWIEQIRKTNPDHLEIEYDAQYDYPTRIAYNQSVNATDGGIDYLMRNLQVAVFLKPSQERIK